MNRRKFLSFLGAGAVAGPKIAQAQLADLASRVDGLEMAGEAMVGIPPSMASSASGPMVRAALRLLGGAPEWMARDWDQRARYMAMQRLDPDIRALKSFSEAGKRNLQADRNRAKMEADFWGDGHLLREARDKFMADNGGWFEY